MSVINHIIIVDTFGHDNFVVRIWYRRHRVLETRVCISEVRETVWCLVQINMRVEFEGGRVERRRVEGRRRWCDIMELTTVTWIHPDSSHRMYLSWFDWKKSTWSRAFNLKAADGNNLLADRSLLFRLQDFSACLLQIHSFLFWRYQPFIWSQVNQVQTT